MKSRVGAGFITADPHLKRIFNDLFDGVYITDLSRKIVFWNKAAGRITGHRAAEVTGRRCSDGILNHIDENGVRLCHGDACPLLRTLRTGEHVSMKVYPLTRDKRRVPVRTHVSPLKDASGRTVGAIEIFADISAEENYRVIQEKFKQLVRKYVSKTAFEGMQAQVRKAAAAKSATRDLTIMFIDVVGFTSLSETLPHKEIVAMLNELFGVCEAVISRHQGDIDKFIGDAAMGVFIAADDAVAAGLEIQARLKKSNKGRKVPVRVRIGVNSGKVIQGDIGGTGRKDLTVIGDVVNVAARIQAAGEPGSVYVSESTYSRLKDSARFRQVGKIPLKGKRHPILVFRRG